MSNRTAPVVLFIERAEGGAKSVKAGLRDRGVRVLEAQPGPEAVDVARSQLPDLVVVEGEVDSMVAGLVAGLAGPHGPQPALLLAVPEDPLIRETLRRRLGPLFYSAKLVDPDHLLEAILSRLGIDASSRPGRRKPPALLLCVDDDPLFLRSLGRTLTRQGYRVVTCGNAAEALDVLSRVGPDLAFVDVMMPGMDGLALTERLERKEGGGVPVVLVSGLSSDEARYEGHCRGARFFLTKPCETQKLLDVVDYLIGDLDDEERRVLKARI